MREVCLVESARPIGFHFDVFGGSVFWEDTVSAANTSASAVPSAALSTTRREPTVLPLMSMAPTPLMSASRASSFSCSSVVDGGRPAFDEAGLGETGITGRKLRTSQAGEFESALPDAHSLHPLGQNIVRPEHHGREPFFAPGVGFYGVMAV